MRRHPECGTAARPDLPLVSPRVAQEAVRWLVELGSDDADDEVRDAWRRWRAADLEHERAWQRIETMDARMRGLSAAPAVAAISSPVMSRRQALRTLAAIGGTGALLWLGQETPAWQKATADWHTAIGERQDLVLADGSRLFLNTDSAVDVAIDAVQRRVQLRRGEILVETVPDLFGRPFVVETDEGRIRPIGTRFVVRRYDDAVRVAVLDGAVEVLPAWSPTLSRVDAGQRLDFHARAAMASVPVEPGTGAWREGLIFAAGTLGEFIAELSRYRRGLLRCDDAVASLRLSGVFPLADIDRVLATLQQTLPVRIDYRSRYWVVVAPR